MIDSKIESKKYPMTSLDVLKKLSIYLTHYFIRNRKETSYDLSGPLLPLKHYPARYQRTLIDYQQDVSKSVKHYFSPLDLRKRLTTFRQENIDDVRHKAILQKIEEYILCITETKNTNRTTNENRRPPWDSSWWKGPSLSFQTILFMSVHGGIRNKRNFYSRFNSTFLYSRHRKYIPKTPVKMRRNYGAQPILKMCPHPYASRGEAERIINHAARLLLVTENYDANAYDHTAPGMKIRHIAKSKTRKTSLKTRSYQSSKKLSSTDQQVKRLNSADTMSTGTNIMNTFKIGKVLKSKDSNLDNDLNILSYDVEKVKNFSFDSIDDTIEIIDFEYEDKDSHKVDRNEKNKLKDKCENIFQICKCKKAVATKSSILKETGKSCTPIKKKEVQLSTEDTDKKKHRVSSTLANNKEENVSSDELGPLKDSVKNIYNDQSKQNVPLIKMNSESIEESVPLFTPDSQDTSVSGWLVKSTTFQEGNDSCYIKSPTKLNVKQVFEVKVSTGDRIGASTNATVWLHIIGDKESLKHAAELKKSSGHRRPFCRGNTDTFKIKSSKFIGKIISIQIGHDSNQAGSDWFLDSAYIRDCTHQVSYFFPCSRWLSIRSEDKQTRVNILAQPCLHEAKVVTSQINKIDVGTQYSDISDENEKNNFLLYIKSTENSNLKNNDSLSDLAVEFSELSFSESSASSLMSVRRHDRYSTSAVFKMCNQFPENVEEATISVKENMTDLSLHFIFKNETDADSENSINENAESNYSPNPISFCDEESS